jgi:hypothetical protein
MVNIEIDHREALEAMLFEGVPGGHSHIVEEAEAHRLGRFGVMARRTDRAEGVLDLTGQHQVGRQHAGAGRAQGSLHGAGAHCGIGIEVTDAALWHTRQDLLDVLPRMRPGELLHRRQRRVVERQVHVQPRRNQAVVDGRQALRRLRVMLPHVMQPAISVRDECRTRHKLLSLPSSETLMR